MAEDACSDTYIPMPQEIQWSINTIENKNRQNCKLTTCCVPQSGLGPLERQRLSVELT